MLRFLYHSWLCHQVKKFYPTTKIRFSMLKKSCFYVIPSDWIDDWSVNFCNVDAIKNCVCIAKKFKFEEVKKNTKTEQKVLVQMRCIQMIEPLSFVILLTSSRYKSVFSCCIMPLCSICQIPITIVHKLFTFNPLTIIHTRTAKVWKENSRSTNLYIFSHIQK